MAALPDTTRATDLYERYSPRLYGYCLHRLSSREEAEDAVQTTFLNAFRGLSRGVVPESESAWLFKIAENVCLSRHRASFRRRRVEAPGGIDAVEETVPAPQGDGDQLIPLEEALAEMPEMQRHALLLREWQGLSYREIATELDVSQSAVETLIFRARRSLARRLEAPRERLRRVGQAIDVGSILAALKGALTTGAAVKGTLAAAAVTGLAVGVAVERPQPRRHDSAQPARVAPVRQPVADSQRADATLARGPEANVAAATSKPVRKPKPQSRSAKPAAAKRSSVGSRPRAQRVAPASRPAASLPAVSHPAPPPASSSSPPAKPAKAQSQPATRGRPADRPAKPEPPPKQQAGEPQPSPSADPGSEGNGNAKGKDK